MRQPIRFSLFVCMLCLSLGSAAAGPARVAATVTPSGINVVASVPVAASVATLWATLTDYNHLQNFIPDMVQSRQVSAPGQPKVVEQRSNAGMFAFVVPEHVFLAIEESPPGSIRFRAIGGAVASLVGEWQIIEQGGRVTLNYRVHMVPLVPVLVTLPSGLVEREVHLHMEALAAEAERRMRAPAKP